MRFNTKESRAELTEVQEATLVGIKGLDIFAEEALGQQLKQYDLCKIVENLVLGVESVVAFDNDFYTLKQKNLSNIAHITRRNNASLLLT